MELLSNTKNGLYCEVADVYIDPWRKVDKALITHGHSDHARPGHKHYMCHVNCVPILKLRIGKKINVRGFNFGESIHINEVRFSFHPAGHVIGSAQIRVEYKGEVWVVTGDYKLENDQVCTPFESIKCHTLITESTFGLPIYKWATQDTIIQQINQWWAQNKADHKISVIYAYSLGKAQRILKHLSHDIGNIYADNSIYNTNNALIQHGLYKRACQTLNPESKDLDGALVLSPQSSSALNNISKHHPMSTAMASGWMATRNKRRNRLIDKGFVLSDHADWDGLLEAVRSSEAERVIVTHGYQSAFARYLSELGLRAETYDTAFKGEPSLS